LAGAFPKRGLFILKYQYSMLTAKKSHQIVRQLEIKKFCQLAQSLKQLPGFEMMIDEQQLLH
jgi:hypothetical protein